MKFKVSFVTLADFIQVRGISRAQLGEMLKKTVKTIDRWCVADVPHTRTLLKLGNALGLSYNAARSRIKHGHHAQGESPNIRGLRYAIALCDYYKDNPHVIGEDESRRRQMLKRLCSAAQGALAALEKAETQYDAALRPKSNTLPTRTCICLFES